VQIKYPRALWDQGKRKLQPLIFKFLNTQIKETHSRFLWTALLGPNFPVVGQKSNVCLKEKRLRQLKSVITLYWIKSGSTFIWKVIQFPRKYRPCYTQAMHPKVQTVLLPLNAQQKNTRTCKFNWNALTRREWMWNAIFIEAVFQTEDLLGNTICSLEPHLITLKWGVTLFSKFFRSRKGDQVHFETTRLEQNSMIMSRDSSIRLKDITLVFRRKLEVVLMIMKNLWTPSCSWKMLHSTLDVFFPKFLDVTNTAILFRPKWSNEYWNHVQEIAVKLEDSLQIKV